MQFTNEDKARMFAMHIGCECIFVNEFNVSHVGIVTGYNFHYVLANEVSIRYDTNRKTTCHIVNCKLHLYDLSDISDEHAIELIKASFTSECEIEIVGKHSFPDNTAIINYHISLPDGNMTAGNMIVDAKYVYDFNCADKLRELGYMIPYRGQNLFESGIAIRKTR